MRHSNLTKAMFALYGIVTLAFLYLPIAAVTFASFSKARYLSFPVKRYTTDWYADAIESSTVASLVSTSLKVAITVTILSMILGFFGALAFARYQWRFRRLFQKFILLPIFFPQTVLGLAILMWLNAVGIIPSWKTAIIAHLVWIAPIATLIIAIRAYSFDPALEEAARDMGASSWQIMREVTLPLLWPGVVSAGLFTFLLSWGNFPLSLFTTGADLTLPEWLYAKMVSGYSPLVPSVGTLTVLGSLIIIATGPSPLVVQQTPGDRSGLAGDLFFRETIMLTSIKDRSVIVTGGSKGIGKGIARVFAAQGAKVMIAARGEADAKKAVDDITKAGGEAAYHLTDVCDWEQVQALIAATEKAFGGVEILCSNAGIFPQATIETLSPDDWSHVLDTNLKSTFLSVKAAIPAMAKKGGGRVVVTSSITGPVTGFTGWTHYGASKAGQLGFLKTAAIELSKKNITINAVMPGNIITEGLEDLGQDYLDTMAASIPLRRLGKVEDIGNAALFFASDEAAYITGQTIVVDGGQILPESLEALEDI